MATIATTTTTIAAMTIFFLEWVHGGGQDYEALVDDEAFCARLCRRREVRPLRGIEARRSERIGNFACRSAVDGERFRSRVLSIPNVAIKRWRTGSRSADPSCSPNSSLARRARGRSPSPRSQIHRVTYVSVVRVLLQIDRARGFFFLTRHTRHVRGVIRSADRVERVDRVRRQLASEFARAVPCSGTSRVCRPDADIATVRIDDSIARIGIVKI